MALITASSATPRRRIVDILTHEFGCPFTTYQRGYWKQQTNPTAVVWFPKMSSSQKGRKDCDWLNIFTSQNHSEFTSEWIGDPSKANSAERHARTWMHLDQVVFANLPGALGYQFIGVYRCNIGKDGKRHYVQQSDKVNTTPLQYP